MKTHPLSDLSIRFVRFRFSTAAWLTCAAAGCIFTPAARAGDALATIEWTPLPLSGGHLIEHAAAKKGIVILTGRDSLQAPAILRWDGSQTVTLSYDSAFLRSSWSWTPQFTGVAAGIVNDRPVFRVGSSGGVFDVLDDAAAPNVLTYFFGWSWDLSLRCRILPDGTTVWTVGSFGGHSGEVFQRAGETSPAFLHWSRLSVSDHRIFDRETGETFGWSDLRGFVEPGGTPPRVLVRSAEYLLDGKAVPYSDTDGTRYSWGHGDAWNGIILMADTSGAIHASKVGAPSLRLSAPPDAVRELALDTESGRIVAVGNTGGVWTGTLPALPEPPALSIRNTSGESTVSVILTAPPGGSYRFATSSDLSVWNAGAPAPVPPSGSLTATFPVTGGRFYIRAEGPLP